MSRIAKIGLASALGLAVVLAALTILVLIRSNRTFDAPYPEITASSDPTVIEKGRYLAFGPAHCVFCHTTPEGQKLAAEGGYPPLIGGNKFELPIGTFYVPNITPDPETGIGRLSDGQLARALRYGVMPSGKAVLPFMEYHDMSDEDLTALLSFLRSQKPVRHEVPPHHPNLLGKAILAFVIEPGKPSQTPPKRSPRSEPTVERGAYLANAVAACAGCHTKRDMMDGSYENARYSGGMQMENEHDAATMFVTPNLTPEPKTGRIANWSEDQFVGRFQAGVGLPGTHMPWRAFSRMSENDLRAIYRYLRSLDPVENATGATLQKKK